ncbi:unnamed protein product [Didymodactylos carnosus]|uniref:Uncharacterized protein n=1 Tax=Didymodactylos carnosus TaxID=1234261 RepID=A0A8S2IM71_9BILA|nr:unnamed protein product [Didymodactylos carnosus]CAF3746044.1 unnamed protein product [Didymodactylos carnosus]
MSTPQIYFDLDKLSSNALSFTDQQFYDLVKDLLGGSQAKLLAYQHINSVPCFLMSDDVCDILNYDIDDPELDEIREEICFKLKSGQYMVKGGIKTSFSCLKEYLLKKTEEKLNEPKKKRKTQSQSLLSNSNQTQLTSTQTTTTIPLTANQYKRYLLNLIKQWCDDNKDNLQIDDLNLTDGDDFTSKVSTSSHGFEGTITCKCGITLVLPKTTDKILLPNYYRHLKDHNCKHVKDLQKKSKQQQSSTTTTTSATQPQTPLIQIITSNGTTSISPSSSSTTSPTLFSTKTKSKRAIDRATVPPAKRGRR